MARLDLAQHGFVAIGDATAQAGRTLEGRPGIEPRPDARHAVQGALALPGMTSTPKASRVLAIKAQ